MEKLKVIGKDNEFIRSFGTVSRVPDSERAEKKDGDPDVYRCVFSTDSVMQFGGGYEEVLLHGPDNIDISLLEDGPILFSHDVKLGIGKIRKAWIENGKGMCDFTFDEGDKFAMEKKGQVDRGYLNEVSARFRVLDLLRDGKRDVITKAVIREVSLTFLAEDKNAGNIRKRGLETIKETGGSKMEQEKEKEKETTRIETVSLTEKDLEKARAEEKERAKNDVAYERNRNLAIDSIASTCRLPDAELSKIVIEHKRDGKSAEEFAIATAARYQELADKDPASLNEKVDGVRTAQNDNEDFELSDVIRYALREGPKTKSVEICLEERERRYKHADNQRAGGMDRFPVPYSYLSSPESAKIANDSLRNANVIGKAASFTSGTDNITGATGGQLVEKKYDAASYITNLRANSFTSQLPFRVVQMGAHDWYTTRKISSASWSWVGENVNVAPQDLDFEQVEMTIKTAQTGIYWTRRMLQQSNPIISEIAMDDLAIGAGLTMDEALITGSTDGTTRPKGLINETGIVTDALGQYTKSGNATDIQFDSDGMTWLQAQQPHTAMRKNHVPGPYYWVMDASQYDKLKTLKKDSGSGLFFVSDANPGMLAGYPIVISDNTNALPADTILFINPMYVQVGIWNYLELVYDEVTGIQRGEKGVIARMDFNKILRQPKAIVLLKEGDDHP